MCILQAIDQNETGELISVDYPFRQDKAVEEFQEETFNQFSGGTVLPEGEDPGWIIPEELRRHWRFVEGKSQSELPRLFNQYDSVSIFLRDSEHSLPCMLFEFEIAWSWLEDGGVILSDDIHRNPAFESFVEERDPVSGFVTSSVGYMVNV